MPEVAIRVKSLSYKYPSSDKFAIENMSLEVPKGSCTVVLGPNGAGKSTLFSLFSGVLNAGAALSFPAFEGQKQFMSFGTQNCALYEDLTVFENLDFFSQLMDIGAERKAKIMELCESLSLSPYLNKRIHQCSGGTKQRTHLAVSLISESPLMILDEPFNNIDPESRLLLKTKLKQYLKEKKGTLLMSSHQLETLDDMWTHLLFIKEGRNLEFLHRNEDGSSRQLEKIFFELKNAELPV